MRGEFRATAERNGHSPLLAEAMVDPDVGVFAIFEGEDISLVSSVGESEKTEEGIQSKVISAKGKLLTLTASEARDIGLAGLMPGTLDELVGSLGFEFDVGLKDRFVYRFMGSHHAVGDDDYDVNGASAALVYRFP